MASVGMSSWGGMDTVDSSSVFFFGSMWRSLVGQAIVVCRLSIPRSPVYYHAREGKKKRLDLVRFAIHRARNHLRRLGVAGELRRRTRLDLQSASHTIADVGQMAEIRARHRIHDRIVQIALLARPHRRQEVLHVQPGRIAAASAALFHNEFARIALVRLEALVAHRSPTIAAIEQIADADVDRIARRAALPG